MKSGLNVAAIRALEWPAEPTETQDGIGIQHHWQVTAPLRYVTDTHKVIS